jgi:hypothetical protein
VSARQGSGFAAYAAKACDCRPRFLCPFCRQSLSGTNTPTQEPVKPRQRAAQPRKRLSQFGSSVGYRQAHRRVEAARGHASSYRCGDCGGPAVEWSYSHNDPAELVALVNGKPRRYSLDSDCYRSLCRQCHRTFDHAHRVFRSWNYPPDETRPVKPVRDRRSKPMMHNQPGKRRRPQ